MFVSFRLFSVFILSLLFRLLLIHAHYTHTHTRALSFIAPLLLLSFLSNGCVCVCRVIYCFLSLFRNWPSDLLLSLFLPTLVYNAVLSSSSVCHCDLFLLYFLSLSHSCSFFGVHSLYLAFTLSFTQSKLVFSLPLALSLSLAAHY